MKLENIGTFSLQKNSVKRELFSPYSRAKGFRDKFLIYSVTSISFCFLFTTHSYYFVSAEQIVRLVSEQVDRLQWTFRHDPPQASHSLATDSRSCSKSGRFVFISEVTGHALLEWLWPRKRSSNDNQVCISDQQGNLICLRFKDHI